jgi:hypothetical protein
VYVGGSFNNIGGQPRFYVAELDTAAGAATTWNASLNPNLGGYVHALALGSGILDAGGQFISIGVEPRAYICAVSVPQVVAVSETPSVRAGQLTMAPNPTRLGVQIQYAVPRAGQVRIELLDASGRIETTILDRFQAPGRYAAEWDGWGQRSRIASGLYFVRLVIRDQVTTKKLVLLR